MEKFIAYPETFLSFKPHFPFLEQSKLERIARAGKTHRKVRNRAKGQHISGDVLNTPPVLCTPHTDSFYIMNGKHRLVTGSVLDIPVEVALVETAADIEHCLSQNWCGGIPIEKLLEQYHRRNFYVDFCEAQNAGTIYGLAKNHGKMIRSVFGTSPLLSGFGKFVCVNASTHPDDQREVPASDPEQTK